MKQAIITAGGKQYLVKEGDVIDVELLKTSKGIITFEPLLVIDEDKVKIGKPILTDMSVTAVILEPIIKADKQTSIRYKAKKRVKKIQGHRQKLSRIEVKKIA